VKSYNDFLAQLNANSIIRSDTSVQRISGIEWKHPTFDQVFEEQNDNVEFPSVNGYFAFSENTTIPETPLLWFRNKAKAVSIQTVAEGNLVVFSFPLSKRNDAFARDILFVPIIYSLVINSLPHQKISYSIGKETFAMLPGSLIKGISSLQVMGKDSGQEYIPNVTVLPGNRLKVNFGDFFNEAGHYLVKSGGNTASVISMNYDRSESVMNFYSPDQLSIELGKYHIKNTSVIETQTKDFSQVFSDIRHGRKLWKWFLLFTVLFIGAEVIIIRFWK
jgi:hypothetical protein